MSNRFYLNTTDSDDDQFEMMINWIQFDIPGQINGYPVSDTDKIWDHILAIFEANM